MLTPNFTKVRNLQAKYLILPPVPQKYVHFLFRLSHKIMGISIYEIYPNLLPIYIKLFTTYITIKTLIIMEVHISPSRYFNYTSPLSFLLYQFFV